MLTVSRFPRAVEGLTGASGPTRRDTVAQAGGPYVRPYGAMSGLSDGPGVCANLYNQRAVSDYRNTTAGCGVVNHGSFDDAAALL